MRNLRGPRTPPYPIIENILSVQNIYVEQKYHVKKSVITLVAHHLASCVLSFKLT